MDNGELQKQQATKIKQTVSRTSRSKKRKWTENSRALSLECESSQEYSFSTAMDGLLEGEGDNDSTKHSISSGMRSLDTTPLDEQMWGSIFNNDYFRSQLSNGFSGYIDTSATSKSVDYEHPFLSQDSTRSILRSPSDLANIREKEVIWGDAKIQNDLPTLEGATWSSVTNKEAFLMSHTEPEAGYSARLLPLPNTSLTDNNSIKPKMSLQGLNGWAARGEIEDTLFMHYLDQVFYVQYPFYDAIDKQNRGWLLSFLKGVKSAYHATLALSELHLLSTHFQNSDTIPSYTKLRCQDSYYDQACREMERCVDSSGWWDESTRLVRSIECLACILQLLFFEVSEVDLFFIYHELTINRCSYLLVAQVIGRSILAQLQVCFRHLCSIRSLLCQGNQQFQVSISQLAKIYRSRQARNKIKRSTFCLALL